MAYISVATIKDPEFINLQPLEINPLMSSCEIKVLYTGKNRNGSFISKEVATEMAKTLRGAPIVGFYSEQKEDFRGHGDQLIIDGDGLKFNCLTKPYGFVAPDAKVWFQEFEETDDFGNKITREYLMTTGYIWDGQYKEAKDIIEHGKPHSMELDNDTLDGKWATNINSGLEFFIINDAIFSKLCILGDDVEPCFEGSSITAPQVSKSFTKIDNDFKQSLYTMMQQLKFALKGGQCSMENLNNEAKQETSEAGSNSNTENFTATKNVEFTEVDKKEKEESNSNNDEDNEDEDKDKKEKDDKYSLLETKFAELEEKYSLLEAEYKNLVEFKTNTENEKKDELIKSFYMLSDEDKKDVIKNKSKYSLDDIEAKLSVICVRKKVNFDLDNTANSNTNVDTPVTTFNLKDGNGSESVPAFVNALRKTRDSKNI